MELSSAISDIGAYFKADFDRRLEDGFQLEDLVGTVQDTVRYAYKRLVESALNAIPGEDGKAKADWAADQFMGFFDGLVDKGQIAVATALGAWAGVAYEVVKGYYYTQGRQFVREWVRGLVEAGIKTMYNVLAADPTSPVASSRLEAALAHA